MADGGKLVQTGVQFPDGTIQTTAGAPLGSVGWNWVNVNITLATGGVAGFTYGLYNLPDTTIGLYFACEMYGGSNSGDLWAIDMYDGINAGTTTYGFVGQAFLGGFNQYATNDGGSGMWSANGVFVPVGQNVKSIKAYQYNQRNRPGSVKITGIVMALPGKY
jgi:hypothetical protein